MGWSTEQLQAFFLRKGIPESAYSFYADRDECYCIVRERDEWLVYYSEHGQRNELGWGKSESQALNLLKLFVLEGCEHPTAIHRGQA